MARGRKPLMRERITTCVNVEREDLDRLQARDTELSEFVRTSLKVFFAEFPIEKLRLKANWLRESIKADSKELELIEKEIELLENGEEEGEKTSPVVRPINSFSKGFVFHHLHLEGDHDIGIYLPKEIHRSVGHSSMTGRGMRDINKAALIWLCGQDTI